MRTCRWDVRLQIANCKMQIANWNSSFCNSQFSFCNFQFAIPLSASHGISTINNAPSAEATASCDP